MITVEHNKSLPSTCLPKPISPRDGRCVLGLDIIHASYLYAITSDSASCARVAEHN